MAEQGYVLDIDTKFLNNLKMADDALARAITHSKALTSEFNRMVGRTAPYAQQLSAIQAVFSRLGAGSKLDFSQGLARLSTEAMTATDRINLLTSNMQQLHGRFNDLKSQATMGMFVNTKEDLSNISALTRGIREAREMLRTGKLTLFETRDISNQIALYKDAMKELSKSDKQRTNDVVKEVRDRIRQTDQEAKAVRKTMDAYYTKNPRNAINFAGQAKSLEELRRAYKYLEQVRNNINPDTKRGQKQINDLNRAMDQTEKKISEVERKNKSLKNSFDGLSHIAWSLGSAFRTVFGLAAIKNFVNNLVQIHGEFEMINKSLAILLHSSARAERVWGQITDLALKSPFQISELSTATKQMAAYRIESDKLYEKTKMLADISAGLGVQMSRLILAYGQVKAANFLRGTELRQFSEAGIDMLGQLAAHFTELEGKAVSAADVFERISKRMVLFEDVDAVLTKVTSKGGAFYNMQEQQAETLRGQVRNLKDEIALMFNEMGESTHGIMLSVIKITRTIIRNWEKVLPVIIGLITAFMTFKTLLLGYGVVLTFAQRQLMAYTTTTVGATLATQAFNHALMSNPIFLLASLIATAVTGIISYVTAANSMANVNEDVAEEFNSVAKIFDEQAREYERLTTNIATYSDKIAELKEEQKGLIESDERYLQINEELSILTNARSANIASLVNINSEYAKSLDSIAIAANSTADAERRMLVVQEELRNLYAGRTAANVFDMDAINKDLQTIQEGYAAVLDARTEIVGVQGWVDAEWGKKVFLNINASELTRDSGEDPIDYMIRVWEERLDKWEYLDGLFEELDAKTYKDAWRNGGTGLWEISEGGKAYAKIEETCNKAAIEYLDFLGKTLDDVASDENLRSMIYAHFEAILAESDLDADSQELLRQMFGTAFGFEWPEIDPLLKDWQKRYNDNRTAYLASLKSRGDDVVNLAASAIGIIRSSNITVAQQKEILDDQIKLLEQQIKDFESGSIELTQVEYEQKKVELEASKVARSFLGTTTKTSTKKESPYKDTLKAIDEIHKAFKTLEKDFDAETAKVGAWEKYGASLDTALKKIGMTRDKFVKQFGDLTSEESVTKAIEWLATQAKSLDDKFDIQQRLGEWRWELNLEVEKEEFNNAVKEIDKMFAGYQLSMELDKLHVPEDFAKDFFDASPISLEDIRKNLYDQQDKFDGTDNVKKFEEYLKKLDELETKAQQDRLKKYLEYSKAIVGDRAKILLDSFNELEDIEKTFVMTNSLALNKGLINAETKKAMERRGINMRDLLSLDDAALISSWGLSQDQIDKIREFNKELEAQRDLAIEASKRKSQSELDTLDWKALKESDTFILAMQDLERVSDKALDKMISRITAYKNEWADMPYSEVKEMIGYLDKLKEARMAYYSPNEMISIAREEMAALGFNNASDAQVKMLNAETRITELSEELSIVEELEYLRKQGLTVQEQIAVLRQRGITDEATISRLMTEESEDIKSLINGEREITDDARRYLELQSKIISAYKEKETRIKNIKGLVDKFFEAWDAVNELFDDGSLSSEIANIASELSESVFSALSFVQNFKAAKSGLEAAGDEADKFGYKLDMAMGVVGLIVTAIKLIAKGFKFVTDLQDKALQDKIDAQVEKVERLKKEYEALEKSIEEAYMAADIGRYTREANKNLEEQIATIERYKALEEDKKKPDEEKIRGYEDEISDLVEKQEENLKEAFSTLTDGIMDDVVSTARGFVDAWYDAFQETGDGMSALQGNFKEMLANMLKQQAAVTLITPYINMLKGQLEQYVNASDTVLSKEEAESLRQMWNEMAPGMNESLTTFFETFKDVLDTDIGSLSGLEKGIQGMTEDQAEVLASYWNSCRFILSNIDMTLTNLASNVLGNVNSSGDIYEELQNQTTILKDIRDDIKSVIGTNTGNHSGNYIKVLDA